MSGGFRARANDGTLFRDRPRDLTYVTFTGCEFACFVSAAALTQMSRGAEAAGSNEIIGRLGGRQCRDARGPYVLVERATLCRAATSSAASVLADDDAQRCLRHDFERECPSFDAVGWFHSHAPAVGLFYSSVDRANQRTWTQPNSIGIVLHPRLAGEGLRVYRGPECAELTLSSLEALKQVRHRLAAASVRRMPVAPERALAMKDATRTRSIAVVALVMSFCALINSVVDHIRAVNSPAPPTPIVAPTAPTPDAGRSSVQPHEQGGAAVSSETADRERSAMKRP